MAPRQEGLALCNVDYQTVVQLEIHREVKTKIMMEYISVLTEILKISSVKFKKKKKKHIKFTS